MKNSIYYYIGIVIIGIIGSIVIFSSMPSDTWKDWRTGFTGVSHPDELEEQIDCMSKNGIWKNNSCTVETIQFTKQKTWITKYPVNCIPNLCYMEDIQSYYNSSNLQIEPHLGNLKGADFNQTSEFLKDHYKKYGINIFDIQFEPERSNGVQCEAYECWDKYSLRLLISNFTVQKITDLGFTISSTDMP